MLAAATERFRSAVDFDVNGVAHLLRPEVRTPDVVMDPTRTFGQPASAIVIPRALLQEMLAPPTDQREITAEAIETWKASAPAGDLPGSIAQVVETLSWEGYPDIHRTAELVGTSVRTLQRHLKAEGHTFAELLDSVRKELARSYLRDAALSVSEVAFLLGYSEPSSFHRAFKRWEGEGPSEFRARTASR